MTTTARGWAPGLSPPGWFFAMMVTMVALHVLLPGPRWLSPPWTLLGFVPVMAGWRLHGSALRAFGAAGTTIDPEGRATQLVRTGPYARTRNPMYLAGVPILGGFAAILGTTTSGLVPLVYAAAASRWVAREEAAMAKRFGAEWEAYRASVRRWL